jgi:hypothetical protein
MHHVKVLPAEHATCDETDADREAQILAAGSAWEAEAERGEVADLVLVCAADKLEKLAEAVERMRAAGLRVYELKSPTGGRVYLLLTATNLERLEVEAERRRIAMKLAPTAEDSDSSVPPISTKFIQATRARFMLKNGRLFSPLERQRIMCTIVQGRGLHSVRPSALHACIPCSAHTL